MRNILIFILSIAFLSGCAGTPPKPNLAQPKTVEVGGKVLKFEGEYWTKQKEVVLFVNGDPIMRGSFPNYSPTLNLNAKYENMEISSYCYFSSVLSKKGGVFGIVASSVQSSQGKSGDTCEMKVGGEIVDSLYF